MKNFFIQLFNYDCATNETILNALVNSSQPEKAVQLMAHILTAQQIWFNRCNGLPNFAGPLWQDDGKIDEFAAVIRKNNAGWTSYLEILDAADLETVISYRNLKGEPFESKLSDILMHIINHGTHHRAQIGQYLRLAGAETLPVTDYIAYARDRTKRRESEPGF